MTRSVSIFRRFPRAFWTANVMEIFERMGWYGFYAVSSLYLTGAVAEGGLGFSSEDRGVIQGLATFVLYLLPAFFGALADRFGYRAMFVASAAVMIPGYLLLGHPRTFWGFFAVYLLVAVGHGMFKPVVVSTVAKTTDESTGTLGFGIFYMMVNIGGFLGPLVAGVVRGWDWKLVFYASAGWIALQLLLALFWYREPARDLAAESRRTLAAVMGDMIRVVGNPRFFLLVFGMLVILVMGAKWWDAPHALAAAGLWIAINLVADVPLRRLPRRGRGPGHWLLEPMRVGEGRYLVFLLLMSGFWTAFNQIFLTLPLYIRDYVTTADLVQGLAPSARGFASFFGALGFDTGSWHQAVLEDGKIKPEFLVNLNAFAIILLQVLISYLARNLKAFTTIVGGVAVTMLSFLWFLLGASGWIVALGILVFSVGEMLASPKSKEYAGRIAPPDKVGMYMGYFYWCVALGNLFGGLLSGVAYAHFGPEGLDRPDLMWILFAALSGLSAGLLALYDRWSRRHVPVPMPRAEERSPA